MEDVTTTILIVGIIFLSLLVVMGFIMMCNIIYKLICNKKDTYTQSSLQDNNIGKIILPERISDKCCSSFSKQLKELKKCKTIYVIIDCYGGSATDSQRMCFDILNHKQRYKSKFVAEVKDKAFSGGAMIALCCDEIIALENSQFSPCDTQVYTSVVGDYIPASDFEQIVKIKGDKVSERTLYSHYEAIRSKFVAKQLYELMVNKCVITDSNKVRVYETFFSGKFSHSQLFNNNEVKQCGITITIKDDTDDWKNEDNLLAVVTITEVPKIAKSDESNKNIDF